MSLDLLRIHNLRNVGDLEIEPAPGINLVWGSNGAGKTSVLEAIFLLGRGRSFRGGRFSALIKEGEEAVEIFGIAERGRAMESRIGYALRRGNTSMRLNGASVKRISEVAGRMPLQLMTPRSHEILERGPDIRRRFIEWGVFHVEPDYFGCFKRYRRALAQRNEALRTNPRTAGAWNRELALAGEALNGFRESYMAVLEGEFSEEAKELAEGLDVSLEWYRGWKKGKTLEEALLESHASEVVKGYTLVGPHRADFVLRSKSAKAIERVSRGQQKMLVAALQLGQARCTAAKGTKRPIILVDDLGAELDKTHRELFLDRLVATSTQVFLTSLDAGFANQPLKVFHVEHGAIR